MSNVQSRFMRPKTPVFWSWNPWEIAIGIWARATCVIRKRELITAERDK